MRDRTHELRQGDDSSDEEDKERVALVVHPGTARLGSPDDEFFQKVRTIRQTIVKLGNKVQELEKQQVTILATPLPEESMKQDLQNLRDEIKQLGREIRMQLKAIEPQKEEADENYNSVNTRMRKTQHGVLSQQFVELINKCNSMQSEYREKNVERIRRQLKITNAGMVSDEELEQMLDSGQSEVFVSNILKDTQVTRQALNEISARHSEIQQLERSIRELHEIFTFLATEVEMQVGGDDQPDREEHPELSRLCGTWAGTCQDNPGEPEEGEEEESHDCHLCVHHCPSPSGHHWRHHSGWITSLIFGTGSTRDSGPGLLSLQLWGQGRASSWTPFLTLAPVQRGTQFFWGWQLLIHGGLPLQATMPGGRPAMSCLGGTHGFVKN
ncbi:syntaxin-4 isoform X3 [Carlito syrichta]|uniref:Syntaxin-4 isoform X3 n=1 Tax=Carlito syrichta TaxID=1868482 RepID=A0A3Q0E1B4_CARSF|nr:syntaxin-4 isoform X3 [Carlito syrichta]